MKEIKSYEIKFGKNVLYSLTTGMYADSFFLFREYVQNAADAIDEAVREGIIKEEKDASIQITINPNDRMIVIEDNGIGICKDEAIAKLINIGDSKKDPKISKGRFGIGRMGGLGYCQSLRFETSAKGEDCKTIVEWNSKALMDILGDIENDSDAIAVIDLITNCYTEKCEKEKHYFSVTLIGVYESHSELLDENKVRTYLSQVAPVPFDCSLFRFSGTIYNFIKGHGIHCPEYNLYLNNDPVYKCYKDSFKNITQNPERERYTNTTAKDIEVREIEIKTIEDSSKKVCAWWWCALTDFEGVLGKYCPQRGIRLRQWNIQIGEPNCLNRFWPEERGNNYYVGEVHVLDTNLVPNARRDYFQEDANCRSFEETLRPIFEDFTRVYRITSEKNAAFRKVENAKKASEEFEEREKNNEFIDKEEYLKEKEKVVEANNKANRAVKELNKKCEKFATDSSSESTKQGDDSLSKRCVQSIREKLNDLNENTERNQTELSPPPKKKGDLSDKPKTEKWLTTKISDEEQLEILKIVHDVLKKRLSDSVFRNIWGEIVRNLPNKE